MDELIKLCLDKHEEIKKIYEGTHKKDLGVFKQFFLASFYQILFLVMHQLHYSRYMDTSAAVQCRIFCPNKNSAGTA